MELPSLVKQVLAKTAPMSQMEHQRINDDCKLWYEKLVAKVQEKQKAIADGGAGTITLIDKAVLQLDSWYIRLVFALGYFMIVRYIQQLMRIDDDEDGDQ